MVDLGVQAEFVEVIYIETPVNGSPNDVIRREVDLSCTTILFCWRSSEFEFNLNFFMFLP